MADRATTDRDRLAVAPRALWRKPWARALAYQGLLLAALVGFFGFLAHNVAVNLPKSHIELGFDFLFQPTRFEIGPNYLDVGARDPVWMTFLVAPIAYRAGTNVSIELIQQMIHGRARGLLELVLNVLVLGFEPTGDGLLQRSRVG